MSCPGSREVPSWREYWMDQAIAISKKSKDPSSQVGCVLIDTAEEPLGQGYNGFVAKCDESKMSWERPIKYNLVIHAEMNALFKAMKKGITPGTKAYVTDGPCDNCLKHMLQAGIREVYYKSPDIMWKRSSSEQKEAIKRLIEATGAQVKNYNTGEDYITDLYRPIPEPAKCSS